MKIKGWEKFQHYKHRDPPWIKLHKKLLNDPEWFALSGDASKMLASCWLLASETSGELPPVPTVAFRLRMTEKRVTELLSQLNHWLEHDASELLAARKHVAPNSCSETETETETELECSNSFERFWKAYPRRVGKKAAEKALAKALRETSIDAILGAIARQTPSWTDPQFIPHPATWLNRGSWSDDPDLTGERKNEFVPDPSMPTREELERRYAQRREVEGIAAEGPGFLPEVKCFQDREKNGIGLGGSREQTIRSMAGIFPQTGMAAVRNSDDRGRETDENNDAN